MMNFSLLAFSFLNGEIQMDGVGVSNSRPHYHNYPYKRYSTIDCAYKRRLYSKYCYFISIIFGGIFSRKIVVEGKIGKSPPRTRTRSIFLFLCNNMGTKYDKIIFPEILFEWKTISNFKILNNTIKIRSIQSTHVNDNMQWDEITDLGQTEQFNSLTVSSYHYYSKFSPIYIKIYLQIFENQLPPPNPRPPLSIPYSMITPKTASIEDFPSLPLTLPLNRTGSIDPVSSRYNFESNGFE